MSIQGVDTGKPKWQTYSSQTQGDLAMMKGVLPVGFTNVLLEKQVKSSLGPEERIAVTLFTHDISDLRQLFLDDSAKVKEEKAFKIPVKFTVEKVLQYLYNDCGLNKYFLKTDRDREDATKHLELLLKTNVLAPEDGQPQMIILDSELTIGTVKCELWDRIHPGNDKVHFIYRRKK